MLTLVLEGGGARGAYQAGVIRTLLANGYEFNAVSGTSIGALNGVMLAQGTFNQSYELWETMEFNKLFDFESKYAENLSSNKFDKETVKYFFAKLGEAISNKGLSTDKIRKLISSFIDEDKLRASGVDYGIMTVSLSELKPYELFLEDIPYGMVTDYVMASANFPGFSKLQIGDKIFADGGLYDNLPINMMINRGHYDILAIETKSILPKRKVKLINQAQVFVITPTEKPGRMLDFNPEPVAKAMKMGHFDAMRYLRGYLGELYYIEEGNASPFGCGFYDLPYGAVMSIAKAFGYKEKFDVGQSMDINFLRKHIVDAINKNDKKKYIEFSAAILHIIEKVAFAEGVERFTFYKLHEILTQAAKSIKYTNVKNLKDMKDYLAFDILYKNIIGGANNEEKV